MKANRTPRAWLVLPVLLLSGFACGGRNPERRVESALPSATSVQLVVKNQYGFPAEIYVVGSGSTIRLGKVLPDGVGTFRVPPAMVGNGSVEFRANLDFDVTARSGPLVLMPGYVVDFVIARPVYSSTATVRR